MAALSISRIQESTKKYLEALVGAMQLIRREMCRHDEAAAPMMVLHIGCRFWVLSGVSIVSTTTRYHLSSIDAI